MTDAWEETTGRRETYAEALARSVVCRPATALTEQEIAERIVTQRERMKLHDDFYRDDFITGPEARLVSVALARQYGVNISQARELPDGQMQDDDGIGRE